MEFIDGIAASRWPLGNDLEQARLRSLGYDPQRSIKNWFVHTFGWTFRLIRVPIHGDPHPANILFLPHGKIALIDFGVWGDVTEPQLKLFVEAVFAVYAQEHERVVELLLELGGGELSETDEALFRRDIRRYVKRCRTLPFDGWLIELGNVVVLYRLPMPDAFALICRFGVLGNEIAQMFFPGSSTIDLVGDEIRAGLLEFVIKESLSVDPTVLAFALMLRARRFQKDLAVVINHPLETVREIADAVFGPLRKNAA
jgi:predicted unusual protein kinase regulating ubiquinone biosynthesis (AarF/ABC1/UbiB family)